VLWSSKKVRRAFLTLSFSFSFLPPGFLSFFPGSLPLFFASLFLVSELVEKDYGVLVEVPPFSLFPCLGHRAVLPLEDVLVFELYAPEESPFPGF